MRALIIFNTDFYKIDWDPDQNGQGQIMKRVVITGMGIVSCLGNDKNRYKSLRECISGIAFQEDFKEMGLRCNVAAS